MILVDATPDLPSQIAELRSVSGVKMSPGQPMDAILLTHAHMGHYAGLIHLGREAAATRKVPVVATPRMCAFLRNNNPWRRLVEWEHIALEPLVPGKERVMAPGLAVESIPVPHRDEDSDTVGYLFRGPSKSLLYVPDSDAWGRWDRPVARLLERADIALLDGTFFDPREVTWRDPAEIPHPTIRSSLDLLGETASSGGCRILFTHLNHSNAALDPRSEASKEIIRRGFAVAEEGLEFGL
jgi:pyrroloquinoline quinone biosynthesis protein B